MNKITYRVDMADCDYRIIQTVVPQKWHFPAHRHAACCDITYILKGRVHQILNGQKRTDSPGTLMWIRENDWHEPSGHNISILNINVHSTRLNALAKAMDIPMTYQYLRSMPDPPVILIPKEKRKSVEFLLMDLWINQNTSRGPLLLGKTLATLYADWFAPLAETYHPEPTLPPWLRLGLDYIYTHMEQGIEMEQLVAICQRSPEHVSRSFQKYLGLSPSQYINRERLALAAQWLSQTQRDILDICFSLGFNSASYFYRLFGERYGCSPKRYRDNTQS